MRILLLTETVPYPLDTGGRIKTWHTLHALRCEHEVHCHAFVRSDAQRDDAAAAVAAACDSAQLHLVARSALRDGVHLAKSLATGVPLTVVRHFSRAVLRAVGADCAARRIDAVYCDHLSMLEYGRRLGRPILHDAHNVEHRIVERFAAGLPWTDPRRPLFAREARRLRAYERARYAEASLIFAVSEVDAEAIRSMAPRVPVVSVPIAVDAGAIRPVDDPARAPDVLFVGAQDWPPNAEAVEFLLATVWPAVLAQVPEARLTVVGRGETSMRTRWRDSPSVRFTGWVRDVEPCFRSARAMVVPLRSGSGMRVKILDAFARGIPVVTTSIGVEGIEAVDGEHALVADTPQDLATAIVRLLRDENLARRLAGAARALVLERYDTPAVARCQLAAIRAFNPA